MAKKVLGTCKLCGKKTELTFEHIPPEKSFNSNTIKKYEFDETIKLMAGTDGRRPWDTEGLKYKLQQKGIGDYYLCEKCNNNTGSWYIKEYVKFTNTLCEILLEETLAKDNLYSFVLEDIHPLRIFKGIMTMFCDINNNCMGDNKIREFILNRDSMDFNHEKYSLYMYLTKSQMTRIQGVCAMHLSDVGLLTLSEISHFPIGIVMYIDKPKHFKPAGLCINDFAKAKYDETWNVEFVKLPLFEVNSLYPSDFRTRSEIDSCFEQSDEINQ